MGRNAEAAAAYKHSLTLNPQFKEAWVTLGDVLRKQGTHEGRRDAHGCYKEALSVDEAYAPAWRGIGDVLRESACFFSTIDQQQDPQQQDSGSVSTPILQEAKECYKNALKLDPRLTEAATGLGLTYALLNQKNGSVYWFGVAADLNPTDAVLQANYASHLYENKDYQAAATAYQKALTANPSMKEAANNLGNALREYGKLEEAIRMYYYCITLEKQEKTSLVAKFRSAAANGVGSVGDKKRPPSASRASTSSAATAGGSSNRNKSTDIDALEEARTQRLCIVFNNLAGALRLAGRYEEAVKAYKQVAQFQPSSADAFANLARALKDAGNPKDAIVSYQMALTLTTAATNNDNFATKSDIFSNLMFCLQTIADWRQREELIRWLEGMVLVDLQAGRMPAVQPFHAVSYPFSVSLTKAISVAYSLECERVAQKLIEDGHVVPGLALENDGGTTGTTIRRRGMPLQPGERLRVGYVSSDYANHPLSHLMASVFGLHKKIKYEIFCYSLSPDDGSTWRARIAKEAEHFIDVSSSTSAAIANRIFQDDQIHILFNLNGFTKGGRNEIFALRPAPVQVSYMGFAGTMGADFMQYIVVDKVVCPDEQCRKGYNEQGVVRMPHSYFVNDYKRSFSLSSSSSTVGEGREGEGGGDGMEMVGEKEKEKKKKRGGTITRSDLDLPEDAIVFACFNQMYKCDPDTFRVWCNILKRVPGSVLWLLRFPPHGEPFIRHTAQTEHGIAADRIIFTNVATKEHHLARCHLADIVLDTLIYNGHTTGCDVLFSGVPLVTVASPPAEEEYNGGSKVKGVVKGGGRMASRVGASLAYATGYGDEMVVNSLEEYEEKAVELGMNGEKRLWLRRALEAGRESCPLFDTERWVRDMEKALDKMWEDCCRGVVADFDVD